MGTQEGVKQSQFRRTGRKSLRPACVESISPLRGNRAKRSQFPGYAGWAEARGTEGRGQLCETKPIWPERQERQVLCRERVMTVFLRRGRRKNKANSVGSR
jgi:hypothetical protein